MAFQKGQSGNPSGRPTERPWRLAIHQALQMKSIDGMRRKLDDIAETLVALAVGGDMAAIKEIGDRMDGKPAQAIVGDADQPVTLTLRWATEDPKLLNPPSD
jgi:Family of unknown function (DUF5681)